MKSYFEKGKVIFWANSGEVIVYDSIKEAYEKENINMLKADFVKALGTNKEVSSGVTAFRYSIDIEATKAYDEARAEAEEYEKENS
jgi:hypothetical protein